MDYLVEAPDGFDPLVDEYNINAPDGFDPLVNEYNVYAPQIGIDPGKVLLIVNSDVALSGQVADYYEIAHGLGGHRLTFALGTSDVNIGGTDGADPDTFYTNVVLPVANYIDDNQIEAVIGSARVPHLVACKPDPQVLNLATMSVLGSSRLVRDQEGGMVRAISTTTVEPMVTSQEAGGWFYEPFQFTYNVSSTTLGNNNFLDFRVRDDLIPYGRIGLPKATALHPAETLAETQRMIDDAVASEGKGAALGTVHFGLHDRIQSWITGYQSEVARQEANSKGLTTKVFVRSYSADWPDPEPVADYAYADVIAGTLNEDAFGVIGAALENKDMSQPWPDSYNFLQGSWGYEATSNGYDLMGSVLDNGGCAAIGAVQEPNAPGTAETHSFLRNLMGGRAFCEAMFFGRLMFPWMMDCWGDPLYAPFKVAGCESCLTPNLFSKPNDMSNWGIVGSATIELDQIRSPGCANDADKVTLPSGASNIVIVDTGVAANGTNFDLSVWMKKAGAGSTDIRLEHPSSSTLGRWEIDCTQMSSGWEFLTKDHPAVTQTSQWTMPDGDLRIAADHFQGDSPAVFYAWCWRAKEI